MEQSFSQKDQVFALNGICHVNNWKMDTHEFLAPYVYKVIDMSSVPRVIKFLPDKKAAQTFIQEVYNKCLKILYAKLHNPENIIQMSKPTTTKSGYYYTVFQEVGETLKEIMTNRKTPFTVKEMLDISRQAALGLAQLQWGGIYHRDVKPSNIIIVKGVVKIIDFDISKTIRTEYTKKNKTTTHNTLTKHYASPYRTIKAQGGFIEQEHKEPQFLEDSFSFGIVMLEMLVNKKPKIQNKFQERLLYNSHARGIKSEYQKYLNQILHQVVYQYKGSEFLIFIPLLENVLAFESGKRIDLMAIYKFFDLYKKKELTNESAIRSFLQKEVKLSIKRTNGDTSQQHEKDYGYIFSISVPKKYQDPAPASFQSFNVEIEDTEELKQQVNYGMFNLTNSELFIYSSRTRRVQSIDLNGEQYPGAKIVSTVGMIYIFGGQDPMSGDIKSTAIGYQGGFKKTFPDVPDGGRTLFGTATNQDLIALVGGLRVNCHEALKILCFSIRRKTWVGGNVELVRGRSSCNACFTTDCLYIFGGMSDSQLDPSVVEHTSRIEKFKIKDLEGSLQKKAQIVIVQKPQAVERWLGSVDGVSVFYKTQQCILLFGGMHSEESNFEIDGYLFHLGTKTFVPIQDQNGLSKLPYSNECQCIKGHIFLGACNLDDEPSIIHGTLNSKKELSFEEVKGS